MGNTETSIFGIAPAPSTQTPRHRRGNQRSLRRARSRLRHRKSCRPSQELLAPSSHRHFDSVIKSVAISMEHLHRIWNTASVSESTARASTTIPFPQTVYACCIHVEVDDYSLVSQSDTISRFITAAPRDNVNGLSSLDLLVFFENCAESVASFWWFRCVMTDFHIFYAA